VLNQARFINDAGRIVGDGVLGGVPQPFILDLASANHAPVAVAGSNQTPECDAQVTLNGGQSSDPDGDQLTYQWSSAGYILGTNSTLSGYFAIGTNLVTLKVTDPCGADALANVFVTVSDTTAPTIVSLPSVAAIAADANCQAAVPSVTGQVVASDTCTPANALVITQNPAAGTVTEKGHHAIVVSVKDAAGNGAAGTVGFDVVDLTPPQILSPATPVVVSVGNACQAAVPDIRSSVVAVDACTPANLLTVTQSPAPGTVLSKGDYAITLTVADAAGNTSTQIVSLKLVDTTAPAIQSLSVSPNVLSSPNHQMVPVTVSISAMDNCDASVVSKIISITANQPTVAGEISITGNLTASLAATRSPGAGNRVYTVTVRATDSSGNSSTGTVTVTVPQGNGKN